MNKHSNVAIERPQFANPRLLFVSVILDHHLLNELGTLAEENSYTLDLVSSFTALDQVELSMFEAIIIDLDAINETCERKLLHIVKRKMSELPVVLTGSKPVGKQEVPEFVDIYIPKTFGATVILDAAIDLALDYGPDITLIEDDEAKSEELTRQDFYLQEIRSLHFWR